MWTRGPSAWGFWGLIALCAALAAGMIITRSGLRTLSWSDGWTIGAGQGCLYVGRVPALAGKGSADWAGIYPEWRFRWNSYPGNGWGLFVPMWAVMVPAAIGAVLVARRIRRGRITP